MASDLSWNIYSQGQHGVDVCFSPVLNVVQLVEFHIRGRLGVLLHCLLGRSVARALA